MDIPNVKVEPRKAAGSRAASRLRRAGKLPAIVYGHGRDPLPLSLDSHDITLHLQHGVHLLNLDLDGKSQACLIKDVQYDHLGSKLIHVDLARVDLTERVTVHVPIEIRGTPKGAKEGGVLLQEMTELEIECIVQNIPHEIRVDVSELGIGDVLHLSQVKLPPDMKTIGDPEDVVAMVREPRVIPEAELEGVAEAAEGEGEPEVIAKGKEDEEQGGD